MPIAPIAGPADDRAFTLLENMLAMLIFALGLILVAGIFPSAVLLQRNTINDIEAREVARHAESFIRGTRLIDTEIDDDGADGLEITTMAPTPPPVGSPNTEVQTAPVLEKWSLSDRSFPSFIADPLEREYYWVPMARRQEVNTLASPHTDWDKFDIFVFVMRRDEGATYGSPSRAPAEWANDGDPLAVPGVRIATATADPAARSFEITDADYNGELEVGDLFLDEYGNIHSVVEVDPSNMDIVYVAGSIQADKVVGEFPDAIWYAPAPDGQPELGSPILNILRLTQVVEDTTP